MKRFLRLFVLLVLFAAFMGQGLFALKITTLPGTWTDAVDLAQLPDGSILIAQDSGLVDRLPVEGDSWGQPQPWADFSEGDKAQLLSLVLDPEFPSSGMVYATLRTQTDKGPILQLTRWHDAQNLVVLSKVLVDNLPSGTERPGGILKFGPDGKLWLGIGDGGAPPDEVTATNLRGVLLRLNPDGSIPADNPHPDSLVWAYGLRDPSGLAWQTDTKRLYILDRGPKIPRGTMDRLDLAEPWADYGWPLYIGREGPRSVSKPVTYCSSGHSWIPGGGIFDPAGPWKGSLLFAGAGQGNLYRLSLDDSEPRKILFYEELINGSLGPLVDVAIGADGRPLLLSLTHLYQLTPEDGD